MVDNKLKYASIAMSFSLIGLVAFALLYQVQDTELCQIVETNSNQLVQLSNNTKINIFKGGRFDFKYNNKNLSFKISNYYKENNFYYLTLNKYLVIENNIYNLLVNTDKQMLITYVFKSIF